MGKNTYGMVPSRIKKKHRYQRKQWEDGFNKIREDKVTWMRIARDRLARKKMTHTLCEIIYLQNNSNNNNDIRKKVD